MGQSEHPVPTARLVHHALHAGDSELTLRFAPIAAHEAAAQKAHREAAAHYATALRFADALSPEQRATLYEGLAYECYLTSQIERAIEASTAALDTWRQLDEREKVGRNLRWLSRLAWFLGKEADASRYADQAIALLETIPPGRELAWAYSNRAQLYMIAAEAAEVEHWGQRAIALAGELGDDEVLAHALNNVGTALLNTGDHRGWAPLERSLALALKHHFEEHAARAYTNLACSAVNMYDYARAAIHFQEGITYSIDHDLDSWRLYMTAWRARFRLEQGDWAGADEDAMLVLDTYLSRAISRVPALAVRGFLRVRRGDPGVETLLQEALNLALEAGDSSASRLSSRRAPRRRGCTATWPHVKTRSSGRSAWRWNAGILARRVSWATGCGALEAESITSRVRCALCAADRGRLARRGGRMGQARMSL